MQIRRDGLIEALSDFAHRGNGIITGPPGVGKTFALKSFASKLVDQNIPCLYLPIDKLGVDTEVGLRAELEIKEDFVDFLIGQRPVRSDTPGFLVIDAFDAARSEVAQRFFLRVVRRVIGKLCGVWNVIVSVRTYDAKKSEELQDLFPLRSGTSPSHEFQMSSIHCRHFVIPKLTDDEIVKTETEVDLRGVYEQGAEDFRELLRIPFNLWLLEKLLLLEPNIPGLSLVTSEVQLLGLFWKQRVTDGLLGVDKQVFLSKVAKKMVAQHSLSVRTDEVYAGERDAYNLLLSSEILAETSTTGQRVAFSHNMLFDYAISVLLIEDEPDRLVQFISEDPSRPLFLRPSLDFYFTRLWHSEPDLFWRAFWHILKSPEVHVRLFARLIPTSVIANEARSLDELEPLLEMLSRGEPIAGEALLRLLQALRVLEIRRDRLWIEFLSKASEYLERRFAWELSVAAAEILDRAEGTKDE